MNKNNNLKITSDELMPVNMLWIGGPLSPIEQLSALSFKAAGHRVVLHTYDGVFNAPDNIELVDAASTMDFALVQSLRERRSGSYALASDYFRYALQAQNAGLWADMDMICVKPIHKQKQAIMGFERPDSINCAILHLDSELPIIGELLGIFQEGYIPQWVDPKIARKRRLKRWLPNRRIRPAIMPWGTYGPQALTNLARKHGIINQAERKPVFYPLDQHRAHDMFDANISLESIIQEGTLAVHLWNESLKQLGLKETQPPRNSPLGKLMKRYGL